MQETSSLVNIGKDIPKKLVGDKCKFFKHRYKKSVGMLPFILLFKTLMFANLLHLLTQVGSIDLWASSPTIISCCSLHQAPKFQGIGPKN